MTIWYHQHMDLVGPAPYLGDEAHPFVVELPGGRVLPAALARHLRAIGAMERGQRAGSRISCAA